MIKIVVCDEELIFVKMLKQELDKYGYDVSVTTDGYQCMDLIRTKMPDVLVTDLFVPRLNSLELISKVREIKQNIAILVYADIRSEKVIDQVFRLGVKDFVYKPVDPDRLIWRIKTIINRK
ncbi:MAG: response regulator [Bacteroidota bacterium]|uniref:response regulator n=1 Tax=Parabacteroides sp. FAFU027 TaxID=2922715 RepID=UPI001FAF359D|nr:response regulator [Parabacteroides sp. FAFU027]MDP4269471.1 response regulator [Bacteroidota bacterium]